MNRLDGSRYLQGVAGAAELILRLVGRNHYWVTRMILTANNAQQRWLDYMNDINLLGASRRDRSRRGSDPSEALEVVSEGDLR